MVLKSAREMEARVGAVVDVTQYEKGTSLIHDSYRKFSKNKAAVFCCFVITILFLASFLAKWVAPYTFDAGALSSQNFPPTVYKVFMTQEFKQGMYTWGKAYAHEKVINEDTKPTPKNVFDRSVMHLEPGGLATYFQCSWGEHFLGTDEIGQDIFSRAIYGMRLSLFLALTVTIVSVIIGVFYGAISGYFGGMVDQVMMRIVDFLFGIPFIFLIILLMVFFGRHVFLIFIGLGLIEWIILARIVRGQVLSIKNKEFILAAVSNGVSKRKIIAKHLVPNVLGPVVVFSTLLVPQIMLLEAFLSFIGLGVSPPDVSLGIMISDGAAVLSSYTWPILYPGIIFSVMIYCLNFIGDGLRDALDPKSSK